jgi:hypothetical protein
VTPAVFFHDLRRPGFTFGKKGDRILVSPGYRLSGPQQEYIRAHKPELLGLVNAPKPQRREVTLGEWEQTFKYWLPWAGTRRVPADAPYVSFDTETDADSADVNTGTQTLVLASASAGPDASCIVHRDAVAQFILIHKDLHIIFHNIGFDFWVVERHLRESGEQEALDAWWAMADNDQFHDVQLLGQLIELAERDTEPIYRDLAYLAEKYDAPPVDKQDPFRKKYGKILGKPFAEVEEGYFAYAVADSIVTRIVYLKMLERARDLYDRFVAPRDDVLPDAVERYGLFSEKIQVKKAIALRKIVTNGIGVDVTKASATADQLKQRYEAVADRMVGAAPGVFKMNPDGSIKRTKKKQELSKYDGKMRAKMAEVLVEINQKHPQLDATVEMTTKGLSLAADEWEPYRQYHPFVDDYLEAQYLINLVKYFAFMTSGRLHPTYVVLKRTGRTSAKDPPIHQIPRCGSLRGVFIPEKGSLLFAIDLSFIELVALAGVCLRRFGYSVLADTIRAGRDPHAFTAAGLVGVPFDEFMSWKKHPDEEMQERFKSMRQAAKGVNFGVPGGLSAYALMLYANAAFPGVHLTLEQATEYRDKLIYEIYPELALYLDSDAAALIAYNLHAGVDDVRAEWGLDNTTLVRRILAGDLFSERTKKPYEPSTYLGVMESLLKVNKNPDLQADLERRYQELVEQAAGGFDLEEEVIFEEDEDENEDEGINEEPPDDPKERKAWEKQQKKMARERKQAATAKDKAEKEAARERCREKKERDARNWQLSRRVAQTGVAVLSGRYRGRVGFTQEANTRFQGLTADGTGLVLYAMIREDVRLTAFLHDEAVGEIPDLGGYADEATLRHLEEVMKEWTQSVLGTDDLPVSVESYVSVCWNKQATLLVEEGRVFPWCSLDDFLAELRHEGFTWRLGDNDQLHIEGDKVLTTRQRLLRKAHTAELTKRLKDGRDKVTKHGSDESADDRDRGRGDGDRRPGEGAAGVQVLQGDGHAGELEGRPGDLPDGPQSGGDGDQRQRDLNPGVPRGPRRDAEGGGLGERHDHKILVESLNQQLTAKQYAVRHPSPEKPLLAFTPGQSVFILNNQDKEATVRDTGSGPG